MAEDISWQGEKAWPNGRVIESFISSPMVDLQNELLTEETFKEIMPWFNENGVYTWYHSDLVIGKPIGFRFRGGNAEAKFGIFDSKSSGIPYHDEVWKILQRYGTKGSSSIRGVPTGKATVCIDNRCFKKITDIGLWAVGWVGQDPANLGATVNKISFAKGLGPEGDSQRYWIGKALGSEDAEIRGLTEAVVKAGLAKEWSGESKMEEEIKLTITEKMKESLSKQVPFEKVLAKCPKCREYLSKMEAAGVPTNVALESLRSEMAKEVLGKAYASFEECVSDNSDKENPEGFCAWLKEEVPGACKGQGQTNPLGGGVGKEGSTMADKPKDTTDKAPPPGEGVKKDEPKTEDYMALIKAQEVEIASLKAEVETLKTSKGDFAKFGEETKKALEDWGKKFSELSERVLGIEGKIGQPAGSGKSRGQSPEDIKNAAIDWSKINSANDVLGLVAQKRA